MSTTAQKIMGKYCKAYPIARLREFENWSENADNARCDTNIVDGEEQEAVRELKDDDHLYVQEDYTVTDGIFKQEHVIYDQVTPEWIEFCKTKLEFEVPEYAQDPEESSQ